MYRRRHSNSDKAWRLAIFALVIFGLIFGIYKAVTTLASNSKENVYSAVFLDNNQVYFGRITGTKDDFMNLTDVYYFGRTSQLVDSAEQINDDITLIKLGNELHGPEDEMRINKEHILYLEKLEYTSKVIKAILNYENNE